MQGTNARPTDGHCDVGFAFHIDQGELDGTALGGLNFVMACYTPGNMADGNWTSALYIDDRANPQQREALGQIMSGKMGGPAERWMGLTTDFRGVSYTPIEFRSEGRVRSVTIPGIIDFNLEPVMGRGQSDPMLLVNTGHTINRDLYLARCTRSTYTDHGMRWDNTGKNGHYSAFDWHWP